MIKQDYYKAARENEEVFRNILRDVKTNRETRPMGEYIPQEMDVEMELESIFKTYSDSMGYRAGRFTILNFSRPNKDEAIFSFGALLKGGAELEYLVRPDNSVEFRKGRNVWRS